jgi:glycosyltransferase involved in cell wall biosynthesis
LGQSVFFAPFQNQSQMPKVYTTGDVLVLPSESETWGLAVNEAMNLGRPAIVSTHVGCGPDLIIEGETGWVFPAGDIEALTALLKQILMLDTEALRRMGKAVRDRVGGYSLEAATAGLKRALASLPVAWRPS